MYFDIEKELIRNENWDWPINGVKYYSVHFRRDWMRPITDHYGSYKDNMVPDISDAATVGVLFQKLIATGWDGTIYKDDGKWHFKFGENLISSPSWGEAVALTLLFRWSN